MSTNDLTADEIRKLLDLEPNATCGLVRCLDVRIATNIAAHRSTSRRLRLAFPAIKQDVRRRLRDQLGEATVES